ncbi:MAG: excinuclease ABC subunit B [Caldiserica bacterium CG17_big_fil_post_rev_8_21_14_2_50_35_7]|nr:MAG: excinuclease ABC subunit B [Caldiserica bacterium CG17_big_fil_post_rev_8_21_14_2_50_35_7]
MNEKFKLVSDFKPTGDQPEAVEKLVEGVKKGYKFQTLLGVTGSGKTFTMANVIEKVQKPTLVISHNKTLAAQLYSEFKRFFPDNAVHYFVSYYDFYQPEAYVPQIDLYIAKNADINEDIARLRHATVRALLERRDVIVVASVSCIYGWDSPEEYQEQLFTVSVGDNINRGTLAINLVRLQYERNDFNFRNGKFRMRGDIIDVFPKESEAAIRIQLFEDAIDSITEFDPLTNEFLKKHSHYTFFPASQFITTKERINKYVEEILKDLDMRIKFFKDREKFVEAQRIEERTKYDLEMLQQTGYCNGIENYSRYFSGRKPGEEAYTLLNFFPEDSLLFIDESHITVPQLRGMYHGDHNRKLTLMKYGFRLPSALDNRPLRFEEFLRHVNQAAFVSATPSNYEFSVSSQVAEQLVRPTGLVDPEIEVRPIEGQIDDLINEITVRAKKNERVLVTTLTKKFAMDLASYLTEKGIKARYLHSDIKTLERVSILKGLRSGDFDCLVGVNLLREGLDLPEVSLVAILDADKEGFLRSEVSLIQTMGRAARNVSGKVIMYADNLTYSMKKAIQETSRRREKQLKYNVEHNITPQTIRKAITDFIDLPWKKDEEVEEINFKDLTEEQFRALITELEEEMHLKAEVLDFEEAIKIRDRIDKLIENYRGKK